MIDLNEIGDQYLWGLAMKDFAAGDPRQAVAVLRDPSIKINQQMREQLASFFEVWPPKRPNKRPNKLSASQMEKLKTLYWLEKLTISKIRENSQEFAAEFKIEPKEILQLAAHMRQEHREAYAKMLGISTYTIEKYLKVEAKRRRAGNKS